MWQTIIVYIIGAIAFGYALFKVYRMIAHRGDPCVDCDSCELRSMMQRSNADFQQKQNSCRAERSKKGGKVSKKSSCGCGKP